MSNYKQLGKLGLFDARVPRYTSYPTAPQFSDATGQASAKEWLSAIPAGSKVSLYIHIPFCSRLCWFCACRTQGTTSLTPVQAYVETLKKELPLMAANLAEGVELEHLHWGGGTPTLLPPDSIRDLAAEVFKYVPLGKGAQFSVEIDPCEVDDARMDALAEAGMNRASIGVQDFEPEIQKIIGREQSYEITEATVEALRERGIKSLNMDILYGLPHQSVERQADSVNKVLALSPDRVALFGYAHVPWMAKRQKLIPEDALPGPQDRLKLFETARDMFVAGGYNEIGIDHFARPDDGLSKAQRAGTMQRNFQGYTEDSNPILIGVGASAISKYPQGYAQNNPSTSGYQETVRGGDLSTTRGHRFNDDDLIRGRLIEALMCDFAISFADVARQLGQPIDRLLSITASLPDKFPDMLAVSKDRLEILDHARPLTRMIAREIDAYAVSQSGHSHAV